MIKLIHGDCVEKMRELPENSVNLTVTSPPYDNLRTYNGNNALWGEHVWKEVIQDLFRVTKQGGVVVWVVGDATIKGSETGTSFKQALWAKECGFNLHDTMIYQKANPVPLTHNRYEQAFEYMFILSKGKISTFNPLMTDCKTSGLYTHRRKSGRVKENSLRARDEITETKQQKQKNNIWIYPVGVKTDNGKHPATFPEQLAHDHILSWSNEGDTVLDPFMGSGTTGKMAKQLKRNFIGIEMDKEYIKIAEARISNVAGF